MKSRRTTRAAPGRRGAVALAFAVLLVANPLLVKNPVAAAENSPTLARSMPAGAIGYAEVSGLAAVIDRLQKSPYLELLFSSAAFQTFSKSENYRKAQAVRKIVETHMGLDLWTLGKQLLGERVAVGLYTAEGKEQPDVVSLVRVANADILAKPGSYFLD